MTRKLRCSLTELPMRRAGRPCLNSMKSSPDETNANYAFSTFGCGTGRFLRFTFEQAWPRLPAFGLDMSEPYVRYARRHLKRWSRINLAVGNAECCPRPMKARTR